MLQSSLVLSLARIHLLTMPYVFFFLSHKFMPTLLFSQAPTFIMDTHVNGTLWLYCSVSDHCQKGMSMEIVVGNNPDDSQTLDKYQAAAAKVATAVAPDTVEGGTVSLLSSSASASSTGTATAVSGNSTATTTALSTTFTSKASTVTATKSGESGSASATGTAATVTASGAASKQAVALGLAGIAGGLALMI